MVTTRKVKWLVLCAVIWLPVLGWLVSEVRWGRLNDPSGKFANAVQYLERGRLPSRLCRATTDGHTYFIAFGPMDTWLAVPSGPAAYVFDESGDMVDWSSDIGDDASFQSQWPSGPTTEVPLAEFRKAFQPPDGSAAVGDSEGREE